MRLLDLIWLGQRLVDLGQEHLAANAPDIPTAELVVMIDLIDHAPSSIGAIAARTGYAQSRVSTAVAAMVERGWLRTATDATDRRRTLVTVLPEVLEQAAELRPAMEARLLEVLLAGVAERRRPAVARALDDLLEALRSQPGAPPPLLP